MSAKPGKVIHVQGKLKTNMPETVMGSSTIEQAFGESPFKGDFPTRYARRLQDSVAFELNPGPGILTKVSE
jgi:hypothetical protein